MNKGKRIFFGSVSSTNTYLAENADTLESGDYAVAASQTAGRGRMGKHWEDNIVTAGGGSAVVRDRLFMSVLLKNIAAGENCEITKYTLLTAVAVLRAVKKLYNAEPVIKWSNDILIRDGRDPRAKYKKVVGILCESRFTGETANVVIGIGVNVSGTREFYEGKGYNASSLYAETGISLDCDTVEAAVTDELYPLLELPLSAVLTEYREKCITLGRQVRIFHNTHSSDDAVIAYAEDIDGRGRLLCTNEQGKFTVNAGEVSVRGEHGYI